MILAWGYLINYSHNRISCDYFALNHRCAYNCMVLWKSNWQMINYYCFLTMQKTYFVYLQIYECRVHIKIGAKMSNHIWQPIWFNVFQKWILHHNYINYSKPSVNHFHRTLRTAGDFGEKASDGPPFCASFLERKKMRIIKLWLFEIVDH